MKIVAPSAEIIEDSLASLSVYQRIDSSASVCYQRDPKPTEEDAIKFCRSMVERKHFATLEFATLHLWVDCDNADDQLCGEKYIQCSKLPGFGSAFIVSGSVRAFLEAEDDGIMRQIKKYLALDFPEFFEAYGAQHYNFIRLAFPREVPDSHKHVAVRFIVNRAISHELVRHRPISVLQESQRYCRYSDEVTFIEPEWAGCLPDDKWWQYTHLKEFVEMCEGEYQAMMLGGFSPQQARAVLPNSTKTEMLVYTNLPEWKHIFSLRCSPAADPEMIRVMRPLRDEFARRWPGMFDS